MATHRCEECWAVLDSAKVLRCTKCKACFYCSRACQSRNWKRLHKRVCSTDPSLRPYIRVEMAVERVLEKLRKKNIVTIEETPKDATCYICLEGDGASASSKLMRGCACRGDSAGFVHLACLTELAVSKEASGDFETVYNSWTKCGNCKQRFSLALGVEMARRNWRRHRSDQNRNLRYNSMMQLEDRLRPNGEVDAAEQLCDEALQVAGNNKDAVLSAKLERAATLVMSGQQLQGLERLQAILPEVKEVTAYPDLQFRTMEKIVLALFGLERSKEAYEMATELLTWAKATYSLEAACTLVAMQLYALTCEKTDRVDESKATFEDILTTATRVLGRSHPITNTTRAFMHDLGFLPRPPDMA